MTIVVILTVDTVWGGEIRNILLDSTIPAYIMDICLE